MASLSAQEQQVWRALMHMSQLVETAADRQSKRDGGIPHSHYGVLAQLFEAPDRRLQLKVIASRLGIEQSRLSHSISSLERAGLVRREGSTGPRRATDAVLTEAGERVVRRVAPQQAREVRMQVFSALSAEQVAQLGEIAESIIGALAPEAAGPSADR